MSFRHLQALVAVAEWGSFLAAGDELGFAQATISQQIASLEKSLGHPLFTRHGGAKAASMTAFGEAMVRHANTLLVQMELATRELDGIAEGTEGTIRIGTYQSASVSLLPHIVNKLHKERPALNIEVVESYQLDEMHQGITTGYLDVALMGDLELDGRLDVTTIGLDNWILLCSTADLERLGSHTTFELANLENIPLVGQHDSEDQRHIDSALRAAGVTPRYSFRSHDNGAIQAMVRAGLGPAIMTRLSIDSSDKGIRIIDLSHAIAPRKMQIALKHGAHLLPATHRFIELAHDAGKKLLS